MHPAKKLLYQAMPVGPLVHAGDIRVKPSSARGSRYSFHIVTASPGDMLD